MTPICHDCHGRGEHGTAWSARYETRLTRQEGCGWCGRLTWSGVYVDTDSAPFAVPAGEVF